MQADYKSFFAWLLPGHSVLTELSDIGGAVKELTVKKTGTLLIRTAPDRLTAPSLLCRLEEALEQKLDTREVIISRRFAQDSVLPASAG